MGALVSVKEAAARLGVSERTVRRMLSGGKLSGVEVDSSAGGGRAGKVWMVDLSVEQLPKKGADRCGQVDLGVRTGADKGADTVSVVAKPSNARGLDCEFWLSFGDALELYRVRNLGDQAQNGGLPSNFLSDSPIDGKNEGVFTPVFDRLDGKIAQNEGSLVVLDDCRIDGKNNSEKINKQSGEYSKLARDISAGRLVVRDDPSDNRKTQVLFKSLGLDLQALWRGLQVKRAVGLLMDFGGGHNDMRATHRVATTDCRERVVSVLWNYRFDKRVFRDVIEQACCYYNIDDASVYRWYKKATFTGELNVGALIRPVNASLGKKKVVFDDEVKRYFRSVLVYDGAFRVEFARKLTVSKFGVDMSRRQADFLAKEDVVWSFLHNEIYNPQKNRWLGHYWNRQDRNLLKPLDLVTTDGHDCDVLVIGVADEFRPVVVEVYDVATGMTLGWAIGRKEDRELVVRAYVDAIVKFGHIKAILQDMGKAFPQSEGLKEQLWRGLKINLVTLPGYSPHLKAHQERNFGRFEDFTGKVLFTKGYISNSIANRPMDGVGKGVKAKLLYSEYCEMVKEYFEVVAPNVRQSGLNHCSAKEIWQKWESEGFRVTKLHDDDEKLYTALLIAFGTRHSIKIRRGALAFRRNGEEFVYSGGCLALYDNQTVEYCFCYDRPSYAYVFWQGKYVGEVVRDLVKSPVGFVSSESRDHKVDYRKNRQTALRNAKNSLLKLDLWDEQKKLLYKNASGFEPQALIADISDLELASILEGNADLSRKVLEFKGAVRNQEPPSVGDFQSVFDVISPEEKYEYEDVEEDW